MDSINYPAVLVAAIASFVIGGLWYGPIFGKQWMAVMNMTKEKMDEMKQKGMAKSYILMFVGSLVTAYVLSCVMTAGAPYLAVNGVLGATAGLVVGFWMWLGFIAPVSMGSVLWEGRPWKLWFLNAGYYLVSLAVMGAIIASWA